MGRFQTPDSLMRFLPDALKLCADGAGPNPRRIKIGTNNILAAAHSCGLRIRVRGCRSNL